MPEALSAFAAWLGASLVVLADGRRGLAVGSGIASAGIVALVLQAGSPVDAGILAAGAAVATVASWRRGGGWSLMPAGSTPRLVLCVASGLLALWVAVSITSGPDTALRFAVVAVIALAGMRAMSSEDPSVISASVVVVVIAAAAGAGLTGYPQGPWAYAAAALVAGFASLSSLRRPRAA